MSKESEMIQKFLKEKDIALLPFDENFDDNGCDEIADKDKINRINYKCCFYCNSMSFSSCGSKPLVRFSFFLLCALRLYNTLYIT